MEDHSRRGSLVIGQILSIALTVGGAISQKIQRIGHDFSALQMVLVYGTVTVFSWIWLIHLTIEYFWTRNLRKQVPKCLLVSSLDAAASLLCLHSYAYLNMPVVILFSTLSIPTVIVLSFFFLNQRYKFSSLFGAFLAFTGVACLSLYQLSLMNTEDQQKWQLRGIVMCVSSAILYGVSNVIMEAIAKSDSSLAEFVALNYSFSTLLCILYLVSIRSNEITTFAPLIFSRISILLLFYVLSMAIFYISLPVLMSRSSATLVNLSLLTANFYSVIIDHFVFENNVLTLDFALRLVLITLVYFTILDMFWFSDDRHCDI